jgi:hypothetical protein
VVEVVVEVDTMELILILVAVVRGVINMMLHIP